MPAVDIVRQQAQPTLDVPLYAVELEAPPSRVCVTGATGYVGARVVERLLAAGHIVHAAVRDPSRQELVQPLLSLPSAAKRLVLYQADLLVPGSYDAAAAGCGCFVHVASPLSSGVPRGKEVEMLLVRSSPWHAASPLYCCACVPRS